MTQGGYFSFGAGIVDNIASTLPAWSIIGYLANSVNAVTSNSNIQVTINGAQILLMTIPINQTT